MTPSARGAGGWASNGPGPAFGRDRRVRFLTMMSSLARSSRIMTVTGRTVSGHQEARDEHDTSGADAAV